MRNRRRFNKVENSSLYLQNSINILFFISEYIKEMNNK